MRKINLIVLVLLAMVLTSADGCDDRVGVLVKDGMQNKEQYQAAGKTVYETVKNTDIDNESGMETAANVVDSARDVVGAVSFIPGVNAYAKPIIGGLTIISLILGMFGVKQGKRANKSEKIADNYSQSIDVARMDGDEKGVIDVAVLEKHANQETKDHFNATGGTVLE